MADFDSVLALRGALDNNAPPTCSMLRIESLVSSNLKPAPLPQQRASRSALRATKGRWRQTWRAAKGSRVTGYEGCGRA